jgi:hypothetical protein
VVPLIRDCQRGQQDSEPHFSSLPDRLLQANVLKYLHAAVERIHNKNMVGLVDEQPCRQLKLSGMRARAPK